MKVFKNIAYSRDTNKKHQLDLFIPDEGNPPLILFIHGGTWMHGDKYIYSKLGENLVYHGYAVAVINYRLYPETTGIGMYEDCLATVKFLEEYAYEYYNRRDTSSPIVKKSEIAIYSCGHSAGGHLSALISLRHHSENIKGCILIDPFGLNIYSFIKDHADFFPEPLKEIFKGDDQTQRDLSPSEHIDCKIPFLILTGAESYPFLLMDNELFYQSLRAKKCIADQHIIKGKTHMGMISQFDRIENKCYQLIKNFTEGSIQ